VVSERGLSEAGGFTVLDGAALVAGAAVSAVHVRGAIRGELIGPGWVVLLGTFFWVALTSAGPFLYLFRRYLRPFPGHPRVGDRLWAVLGLPWLATTLLQTPPNPAVDTLRPSADLLTVTLAGGIGMAAIIAVAVVWGNWVVVSPQKASQTFSGPWTNRVGLILAIAWPIQCGLGMVVIG
jgi:hypothetical protein